MKILVPVKQALDPGLNICINSGGSDIEMQGVTKILNPFCAVALEQAVRLKDQGIATEVVVVCISDNSAKIQLRKMLACGADRAILIETESEPSLCPLDIAKLLCEVVKKEVPELILMGTQAVDYDNNQTGQMLSVLLGWPQITAALKIAVDKNTVIVEREVDDGVQTLSFDLPGLVTVGLCLNEPRFASLPDIMKAQSKPLDTLKCTDFHCLGLQHLELVEVSSPQKKVSLEMLGNVNDLAEVIKAHAYK